MPAFSLPIAARIEDPKATPAPGLALLKTRSYRRIELAPTRTAQNLESVAIEDDDVVALELEGGFKLWLSGKRLRAEAGRPPSRDGGDWQLAPGLALEDRERGLADWAIKGLEILGLDPVGEGLEALARHIERHNGDLILHRDPGAETGWAPLGGPIPDAGPAPVLLFVHGTFSGTVGGFGDLFKDRRRVLELTQRYGERIYGYEQRTVTEDPIDNCLALVPLLPQGARLHLVSHSRGGLVGDLLAFAARGGADRPFGPEELAQAGLDRADLRDKLQALGRLIAGQGLRVERFVRVASPSRGTSLASGRLDRWLSILANLASASGAPPLAEGFLDLLVAVTQQAIRPEALPGLAAMTPGSPLIRLLNGAPDPVPGLLAAVAGDIQAEGLWSRVKLLIPDLFFAGDHDLVVNTGSMYGGPAYETRTYLFDRGPKVDHFSYFANPTTAPQLVRALTDPALPPAFAPLPAGLGEEPVRGLREGAERRPVLFVLPGIMGSQLSVDGRRVWLDIPAIAVGRIGTLDLDGGRQVSPEGLIAMTYGQLLTYFRESHDVVPFAYDWRQSVQVSAAALAREVEAKLVQAERYRQPVRILAHSMGGLVARAMIADHPRLWQRVLAGGGRLAMLGTPNGGSWEIVRLLTGRASTLKKLALIDFTRGKTGLLKLIGEFAGVLDLLPDDAQDFFGPAAWEGLKGQDEAEGQSWRIPGQGQGAPGRTRLEQAGRVRARLRAEALGPEGMVYVAGQAPSTACGVRASEREDLFLGRAERTLEFLGSTRGDGSVLWEDGPLPGMPTWYMTGVEHGDLANAPAQFPAIRALLVEGRTAALPQRPPVSRGLDTPRPIREREPGYYPDESSIVASALWMGPSRAPEAAGLPVRVSVVHGNLAFARHPVAVGHYRGSTVIAAEAYLDRVLGGRLGAGLELGIYPGPLGSSAYFAHPYPGGLPRGALVVGLGSVGELTAASLTEGFAAALLRCARVLAERPQSILGPDPARDPSGDQALEIRISSLLIGTGAGGIGVRPCVVALLRGIARANQALECSQRSKGLRIGELEIVEIREDLAMEAAQALGAVERDPELARRFDCQVKVRPGQGGHRAGPVEPDSAWWQRLQVLGLPDGGMRFAFLTERARAEESLLAAQRVLVDAFVAEAIGGTGNGSETSRTLFEMLLPNRLKDGTALRSNLVLVVDEDTARFPWELLEDRWSASGEPPAVEHGLLRQLQTGTFRADPRLAVRGKALVIGEPRTDLPELPGARAEAEKVQDTLKAGGFSVEASIGREAGPILVALHGDAYQVLHLAGHGVHNAQPWATGQGRRCPACRQGLPPAEGALQSGMVIGPGQVLTAQDVEQMRQVPELVFINCCHLGRTDGSVGQPGLPLDRNLLAANLAVAFIRMGVRAVIAAGWAVDDAAALTFCETFYRQLGAGERFGEAVRLARSETWHRHPGVNTWGAYQCYGDPDYRLGTQAGSPGGDGEPPAYVSPSEALSELDDLAADAQVATRGELEGLRGRLQRIDRRLERTRLDCEEDWGRRGELLAARGQVCAELGLYEEAVRAMDAALASDAPGLGRDLIERRARCQSRVAFALHASGQSKAALQAFDDLLAELGAGPGTGSGAGRPPSMDRLYSISGVLWRRIQVIERTERKAALETILRLYDEAVAARPAAARDPLGSYSRLLWLAARFLLSAYSKQDVDTVCPDFDAWCERIAEAAQGDDRGGLRADVTEIEVDLLRLVRHRGRIESESGPAALECRVRELGLRLAAALGRGLSARQWSGLDNHFRLLATLLAEATVNQKERARDAAIALALLQRLRGG